MARVLLLTAPSVTPGTVMESLEFLDHRVTVAPASTGAVMRHPEAELVLVDARRELTSARSLCQAVRVAFPHLPVLPVLTEGGLAALSPVWRTSDFLLHTAGPAELSARLRMALAGTDESGSGDRSGRAIHSSGVVIDEETYTVKVNGEPMNLTFREFELLKHLAQHPGRVFTREHLLHEVWGYDFYGGTRTVDVHVRRLRAKLGPDREQLIGTVRNVGYRFVPREHAGPAGSAPGRPDG